MSMGARLNDGINSTNGGHARVYKFNGSLWVQMGQDLDGEYYNDQAGFDVDLSANGLVVAVGAILNDGGAPNGGHVRVFQYNENGNIWEKMGNDLDGDEPGRYFGRSLALSADGQVLASSGSDYVLVHRYDGTAWNMLG